MSSHPNVILKCTFKPKNLPKSTFDAICAEWRKDDDHRTKIGGDDYHIIFMMDEEYNESWQLSGKEGDIFVFDMVTYGYGEEIAWAELQRRKTAVEEWANAVCDKHACEYSISVTANYW